MVFTRGTRQNGPTELHTDLREVNSLATSDGTRTRGNAKARQIATPKPRYSKPTAHPQKDPSGLSKPVTRVTSATIKATQEPPQHGLMSDFNQTFMDDDEDEDQSLPTSSKRRRVSKSVSSSVDVLGKDLNGSLLQSTPRLKFVGSKEVRTVPIHRALQNQRGKTGHHTVSDAESNRDAPAPRPINRHESNIQNQSLPDLSSTDKVKTWSRHINESGAKPHERRGSPSSITSKRKYCSSSFDRDRAAFSGGEPSSELNGFDSDLGSDVDSTGPFSPLWDGARRRTRVISSPGHYPMVKAMVPLIIAIVSCGLQPSLTQWPEAQIRQLDRLIRDEWTKLRKRFLKTIEDTDYIIDVIPLSDEARKIFDAIGANRSSYMQSVRKTVKSSYSFFANETPLTGLIQLLQRDDSFACEDYKTPTERRFLADVIVKSIAGMFFASKASLGRYHVTKGLFKPLPAEVVIFATALIHHAIGEFATGIFKNERLEEGTLELTHRRITATWNAQSLQRQHAILTILRRRIVQQVGWEESEPIHQTDAVSNPFNNSLDDLQGLMESNNETVGPTAHSDYHQGRSSVHLEQSIDGILHDKAIRNIRIGLEGTGRSKDVSDGGFQIQLAVTGEKIHFKDGTTWEAFKDRLNAGGDVSQITERWWYRLDRRNEAEKEKILMHKDEYHQMIEKAQEDNVTPVLTAGGEEDFDSSE